MPTVSTLANSDTRPRPATDRELEHERRRHHARREAHDRRPEGQRDVPADLRRDRGRRHRLRADLEGEIHRVDPKFAG